MKSIITSDMDSCYVCGCQRDIEVHHIFFGTANRKLSDAYGLVIPLCRAHHTGRNGVHFNKPLDTELKEHAQRKFQEHYRDLSFREIFGRNYL